MRRLYVIGLSIVFLISLPRVLALAQEEVPPFEEYRDVGGRILEFLYSIAHYIGIGFVKIINLIIPGVPMLEELTDPIGVLALLTIFLVVAQIARKLTWIVVVVGWVLIVARIVIVAIQGGG